MKREAERRKTGVYQGADYLGKKRKKKQGEYKEETVLTDTEILEAEE